MMAYLLLSHALTSATPTYGNRDNVQIDEKTSRVKGDTATSFRVVLSSNHVGTHVDAPKHFFAHGRGVCEIPPDDWVFNRAQVIDIPCTEGVLIGRKEVEENLRSDTDILLIRTGYERYRSTEKYWRDNPGLSLELASFLRGGKNAVRCVGIDAVSITSWNHRAEGRRAHEEFLSPDAPGRAIHLIEDMSLREAPRTSDFVVVLPLLLGVADSAPVTVLARGTRNGHVDKSKE